MGHIRTVYEQEKADSKRPNADLFEIHDFVDLRLFRTVLAWTIKHGTKAPQAAGVIHGDFEKGFIRAETISYDDFIAHNGEQGAKDAGRMRAEGKSYTVKDGDVLHFLFNK